MLRNAEFYLSLVVPLLGWSMISFYFYAVARGLENKVDEYRRQVKIVGYIFLIAWAPLLTYHSWQLLKKLKQLSIPTDN